MLRYNKDDLVYNYCMHKNKKYRGFTRENIVTLRVLRKITY